jgi:hypothetical protein
MIASLIREQRVLLVAHSVFVPKIKSLCRLQIVPHRFHAMRALDILEPQSACRLAYRDTMVKATADELIRARGTRGTKPFDAIVLSTTIG